MFQVMSTIVFVFLFALGALHASNPIGEDDFALKMSRAAQSNRTFQLPEAQVLSKALSGCGLDHFLDKTKLPTRLEKRELTELDICKAVELAFTDFAQYLAKGGLPAPFVSGAMHATTLHKSGMIESIIDSSKLVKENSCS